MKCGCSQVSLCLSVLVVAGFENNFPGERESLAESWTQIPLLSASPFPLFKWLSHFCSYSLASVSSKLGQSWRVWKFHGFLLVFFANQPVPHGTPLLLPTQPISTLGPEWVSFLPRLTSAALLLPLRSVRRALSFWWEGSKWKSLISSTKWFCLFCCLFV